MKRRTIVAALLVVAVQVMAVEQLEKQSPPVGQGQPRQTETQGGSQRNVAATESKREPANPVTQEAQQSEKKNTATDEAGKENRHADVASEDDPIATYTLWLTAFTGGLTLFTAVLAGATIYLYRVTKKAANAAAKSADVAEKALIPGQRAYVFVTVHMKEFSVPHIKGHSPEMARAWAIFKNHGATPAILVKLRGYISPHDTYPSGLIEHGETRPIPEGLVIGAGEDYRHDFIEDLDTLIPEDPISTKLLCLGLIEYKDIFGNRWKTGYCWEYQSRFGVGLFHIAPTDELNYRT